MNDLEKALETIAVAVAEVEWNYPLNYAIAFETAIEVLKEKLEREQGCEMCNSNDLKGYYINSDSYGMSVARRIQSDYTSLPYCPNCGRKLRRIINMKAKELANILLENPDFDIQLTVHKKLSENELVGMTYPYPYANYKVKLELDDIGYSDKLICLGCELKEHESENK